MQVVMLQLARGAPFIGLMKILGVHSLNNVVRGEVQGPAVMLAEVVVAIYGCGP
jgi:hypothetical protein